MLKIIKITLLVIVLLIYIALLIASYKTKSEKINAAVNIVTAILWASIAVNNWSDSHIALKIAYVTIILASFIAGVRGFFKSE